MFSFKKLVVSFIAVVFAVPAVFAQTGAVTKDASGGYSYETTIGSLVERRVVEEIKLINNSSYSLTHVTCTVTINGKTHDMRPMPVLKLADSEGFDGYFEDDMYKEFPKYFGKDGKFSKKNNNTVKFTFNFRDHNDMVAVTDVYDGEEDLCFVVADAVNEAPVVNKQPAEAPAQKVAEKPAEVPAEAPAETAKPAPAKEVAEAPAAEQPAEQPVKQAVKQSAAKSADTTVVIDGKSYLIHDGKAYQIQ